MVNSKMQSRGRRARPSSASSRFFVCASLLAIGPGCGGGSDDDSEVRGPVDEVPLFHGVKQAEVTGFDSVRLSWDPAVDVQTASDRIVYVAYAGDDDKPISLAKPVGVSIPGAASLTLSDVPVGEYRFVVRARDEDNNEDDNRASVNVVMGDQVAPEFAGVTGAIPQSAARILVEWKHARDNVSPYETLSYLVYAGPSKKSLFSSTPFESLAGATSLVVPVEAQTEAGAPLWIAVRAQDPHGNVDNNERITSTDALEAEAPEFSGLASVAIHGGDVELKWSPAIDNATASAEIVYRVYAVPTGTALNLLSPHLITEPGVTRIVLSSLDPSTEYTFLVQAQDLAGNRDENSVTKSIVTPAADIDAPLFSGLGSLESLTPTSVNLSWEAAGDNRTLEGDIVYEVFLSKNSGSFADEPTSVTLSGRTSTVVLGLTPKTTYFALVRARDEAGNLDENTVELSVTTGSLTGDATAPQIVGAVKAALVPSRPDWLLASFTGATDNQEDLSGMRAHVCAAKLASECEGPSFFSHINVSSTFGSSSAFVTGLEPRSSYWVSVRLEDRGGNIMAMGVGKSGSTATSFDANVLPLIESRCNQCHGYQYGTLVSVPSTFEGLYLIDPTSATKSYLLRTMFTQGSQELPFSLQDPASYLGDRMPSDGTDYFTEAQRGLFVDWVSQGAFDN